MNIAKDKSTGEEVEAEELKLLPFVDQENYECIDVKCRIQLFPCSYKKYHKKRPYFKTAKGIEHTDMCDFNKYTSQLRKARISDISKNGVILYPYPSKLIKPAKKTFKVDDNLPTGSIESEKYKPVRATRANLQSNLIQGNRVVTSIGQIVDFYLNSPFNRDARLDLLDKQMEYQFAFKRIKGKNVGQYTGRKIYYGIMHLYLKTTETQNDIQVQLLECQEWVKGGEVKSQKNPYKVSIELEDLSVQKKAIILNEIAFVKEEQISAKKKNDKYAFIFFLGDPPDIEHPYTFKVYKNYVVCRYDEILKTV